MECKIGFPKISLPLALTSMEYFGYLLHRYRLVSSHRRVDHLFIFRYRRSPGQRAVYAAGNT
jgi:hypothetical protein